MDTRKIAESDHDCPGVHEPEVVFDDPTAQTAYEFIRDGRLTPGDCDHLRQALAPRIRLAAPPAYDICVKRYEDIGQFAEDSAAFGAQGYVLISAFPMYPVDGICAAYQKAV